MNKVKLDEVDHQILDILIDNTRVPFTDIAKRLFISAVPNHETPIDHAIESCPVEISHFVMEHGDD